LARRVRFNSTVENLQSGRIGLFSWGCFAESILDRGQVKRFRLMRLGLNSTKAGFIAM
jgi:hypothetical protein